jgi:hypothetical protein
MQRFPEETDQTPGHAKAGCTAVASAHPAGWRLRRGLVMRSLLAAALFGAALASDAVSAPPPNADPALHAWFDRQRNVRGILCCSIADGHILSDEEWRTNGGFYEVYILGEWRQIQPSQLRDPAGGPNPTGRAIVWYTVRERVIIYCFAPGTEL